MSEQLEEPDQSRVCNIGPCPTCADRCATQWGHGGIHLCAQGDSWAQGAGRQELSKEQYKAVENAAAAVEPPILFERLPAADTGLAPDVVWQRNHILVSDDIPLSSLAPFGLGAELATNPDGTVQQPQTGFSKLVKVKGSALAAVDLLSAAFPNKVGLNHLVSICPVNLCPADEPLVVPAQTPPTPPRQPGSGGLGILVKVIDTGMAAGWRINHPWLDDGSGSGEVDGTPNPTFTPGGEIEIYAGHGEFIAGVLRCVAPRVTVRVSAELKLAGAATEFDIRNAMLAALNATPKPHIICLSAGCTTIDGQPPQALKEVVERMRQSGSTLLVAAAGNDGLGPGPGVNAAAQFYPAAFAKDPLYKSLVVAVGALREDRLGRACFSNFEDWVSVYEDGERLKNAFPTGPYTYHEPLTTSGTPPMPVCLYYRPPIESDCTCVTALPSGEHAKFEGMASWSGTSFSAPIIAGRIAAHMTQTSNTDARDAWNVLRNSLTIITDQGDNNVKLRILPRLI